SAVFVILFFVLWNRSKSIAKAFAALAAVSGFSGAVILLLGAKEKSEQKKSEDADESLEGSDFDFDVLDGKDVNCSFEDNADKA
ncbi:MAG TPA: hypothetical protein PLT66_07415, partial [Bacillota bacterium]|nr:hypothetical protein [Bacillota bacterium]